MIETLFWKEYREHRSVWIAMALLAIICLAVATEALLPQGLKGATEDNIASVLGGGLILTAMYGLVCGAMMLAGERESNGMAFLDILPMSRAELWWSKCLFGLVFVLLYSAVVIATGVVVGVIGPAGIPVHWAVVVPMVGVETFALGLCASTYSRTVLTAVALAALLPLPLIWFASGMCLVSSPEHMTNTLPIVLILHGAVTLGALGLSLATFVDRDFEKRFVLKPRASSYGTVAPKRQPRRFEVMLWLALRQGRILTGVLCVLGFLLGMTLPEAGVGVWPVATLLVGVACGTAVFMGEQAEGAFKFWGDQRLPVGWLWLRRSGLWLWVSAAVGVVMLLGALIHVAAQSVHGADPRPLFEKMFGVPASALGPGSPLVFLLIWPAYGFALGQLCALVWRKSAVAVVVAVMTSAGVACLMVPSMLGGGLHLVQAFGVPLILLGGCRLALWDWVTDRLRTRAAVMRLLGGVALAWAWMAASFAYRVVEVPHEVEPFDRAALQAYLSDPEVGRAGLKIREALLMMKDREDPNPAAGPFGNNPPFRAGPPTVRDQIPRVIEQGWGAATPELQNWLDRIAADPLPTTLTDGAGKEPAVFIDPRTSEETLGRTDAVLCRKAAELLTVRALQVQARGADEQALEYLITVLALSRHLRHQAPIYAYLDGVEAERGALAGLDHWRNRLGPKPKLLRRALDDLKAHESAVSPATEVLAAAYLRFSKGLGNNSRVGGSGRFDTESLLMQTPWEAERARRLADAVFAGRRRMAESGEIVPPSDDDLFADWLPDASGPGRERLDHLIRSSWLAGSFPNTAPMQIAAQMSQCRVRAARLQMALAHYQAEQGKAATSLDDLQLPALPEDPYSRQSFHYRVSQGERITWSRQLAGGGREFVREVPAGWGILWSVGPDGGDDGGTRQWEEPTRSGAGRDVIFLVPTTKAP